MPAINETQYVRHVRFEKPLKIMMDGNVKAMLEQLQFRSILARLTFDGEQTNSNVEVKQVEVSTMQQLQEVCNQMQSSPYFFG